MFRNLISHDGLLRTFRNRAPDQKATGQGQITAVPTIRKRGGYVNTLSQGAQQLQELEAKCGAKACSHDFFIFFFCKILRTGAKKIRNKKKSSFVT